MIFRPCLVIPVYDPGPILTPTIESLLVSGLPIYITDDGSGESDHLALDRLASKYPAIRLSTLPENRGKGAAVMEGLRRAHADGFTHALQVDADGQHDPLAVESFLALGETHENAVIAGVARYDGSVPLGRKYGRYVTHLWVWIETLSLDIGDSLCGFRLYPLQETIRLMDHASIPHRMDFDAEMIVRLHWMGVQVVNADVRVIYPEDGVSHFHLWRDNVRLIRMHTRLFLGMLRRAPSLLWQRIQNNKQEQSPHWSRIAERGTMLGLRSVLWAYRLGGQTCVRVLTEFIVAYFFLTGSGARQASRDYLTRLYNAYSPALPDLPKPPGLRDTYRHFRAFAASSVDKFLSWMDCSKGVAIEFPEQEAFESLQRSGTGAIFLSAHLGNLEVLRALGNGKGLKGLNAVVYSENAMKFHTLLRKINPGFTSNLIHISSLGPDTAIILQEKLEKGESLFIVGDRTPVSGNARTVSVPFLGSPARFPAGPLLLAHMLQCPVYLIFCIREGHGYRVHMTPFAERLKLPRSSREKAIREGMERYARCLEEHCCQTPFQWFNFFDFWASGPRS